MTRLALVDDSMVSRNTFARNVQRFNNLEIVLTATSGDDCLQQMKALQDHLLPQVVFADIEMPGMNGIEMIATGKFLYPSVHFIVLSMFEDDDKIFEAIKAGASGYLLKHETYGTIHDAVVNVLEYGGAPMSPAIARKALQLLGRATPPEQPAKTGILPDKLTAREQEILTYMIKGLDTKSIAEQIQINVLTLRKHIDNIYQKLHVRSRAQIVNLAHQNKWL